MKNNLSKTAQQLMLIAAVTFTTNLALAQTNSNGAQPQPSQKPAPMQQVAPAHVNGATPMNDAKREEQMKQRKMQQEEMMKISSLNKEIQEADKGGKGETPEIVAKKAELKKLQEARNTKMKAEREQMMKDRPMPTPEEMEANKKMGQLNKEVRDAEKEGKGETPEVVAKKAELKKMQEARMAKMKAQREQQMKDQKAAQLKVEDKKAVTPVKTTESK
jgi:colicin import membrane protein